MTQNEHVCAICCRLEVADIISGQNIKAVEGYVVVCFGAARLNSFQDIKTFYVDDSIKH